MKTIQKLTLGLLTVVASSTAFSATNLILEVNSDSADVTGSLAATSIQKIGNGIANVTGAVSAALQLTDGQFNVSGASSMPSAVTFDTNPDNILKINVASQVVPALTMSASGQLLLAHDASWGVRPSGASTLTVEGTTAGAFKNLAIAADMSGVATPVDVNTNANLQVGGASRKATTGTHRIYGMLEILTSPVAGCVPGQTTIFSGGALKVAAGITAPQYNDAGDLFGDNSSSVPYDVLQFNSGAKLILGAGATWARNITVGSSTIVG